MWLLLDADECHGDEITLRGARHHHLARVSRARAGEVVRAALPDGRVVRAEICEITAESLHARIVAEEPAARLPACRIALCQAVLKGEKMDFVAQKASELGACTLTPLLAQRSIPRWAPAQALERAGRWQRIADAAAEQCERRIPLQVARPQSLADAVAARPPLALLFHERDGYNLQAVAAEHPAVSDLALYLGPEGGWDDSEVALLRAHGVIPIYLGSRILRAETAAVAALTLAQYLWGDLR